MPESDVLLLRWRDRLHPAYALSMVGFIGVLVSIARRDGQFQSVHRVTMGLGAAVLAYALVAQIVNRTRVWREGERLRIAHGPLPWRGALAVPLERIGALRCDPHSRRLVLRTDLGEEIVLAENLAKDGIGAIDAHLRRIAPPRAAR